MRLLIAAASLCILACSTLSADEVRQIELTLSPQAIESPVLKYRLLPKEADLKPGNAAPILLRLCWEQSHFLTKTAPKLEEWSNRPLKAPEWKDFPQTGLNAFYDEMKRAAYRREAVWEYPIGERPAYSILLPDAQGLRSFAGFGLSAKVKYHLTRGELDEARESILVGLATWKHVAQTPFLITQLVAAVNQLMLLERTADLISQPNSPNLYWALSTLPDSLLQLQRSADLDASMLELTIPAANELDRPRTRAEWRKMADQLFKLLAEFGSIPGLLPGPPDESPPRKGLDGWLDSNFGFTELKHFSPIRLKLAKLGRSELSQMLKIPPEKVAAMSDDEAGIRWYIESRRRLDQHASAAMRLPPREAMLVMPDIEKERKSFLDRSGLQAGLLDPPAIYVNLWMVFRQIQILRIIEAVRDYAAKHEGKFPEKLSQIDAVSIPRDSLTDQPFEWTCDIKANEAVLKTVKIPYDPEGLLAGPQGRVEYRLRMRTGK